MYNSLWLSEIKKDIQQTLNIVHSFMDLFKIQLNTSMSKLIVYNFGKESWSTDYSNKFVQINNTKISYSPSQNPICYLEIWLYSNKKFIYKTQKQKILQQVNYIPYNIRKSKITDKQTWYLINSVLFLQMLCSFQWYIPSSHELTKLNSKIKRIFKHKINCSEALPDAVIYNPKGYKLFSLSQKFAKQLIIELIKALDNNTQYGLTIWIRIQALQNYSWSTKKVWSINFKKQFSNYTKVFINFYIVQIIDLIYKHNIRLDNPDSLSIPIQFKQS